jgi:hypothetical protein
VAPFLDVTVGTVASVPGHHRPGLIRDSTFDDEDQLVPHVPVKGELRAGREARHLSAAFGRRILPENLEADSGLKLLPPQVADRDDL